MKMIESYKIFYKNGYFESDIYQNIGKLDFDACANGFENIKEIHFKYVINKYRKCVLILENVNNLFLQASYYSIENNKYVKINDKAKNKGIRLLERITSKSFYLKKILIVL